MRYSIKFLKQYIDGDFTLSDIKNWLTKLGLNPVFFKEGDDDLFQIEVPANRGDLFSAIGIIKAIAPFGEIFPLLPVTKIKEESDKLLPVEIEKTDDCPFYAGRIIEDVRVDDSPPWLVEKVCAAGFRSINNVVDITNLILWELGQPLHAFDLDLLCEKIVVRRAKNGEQVITLDGVKRSLSSEMLLISDAEKAVAIAGVMGGLNTEVTKRTRNLFIESAFFNPGRIRRTSKLLGLSTDASSRFEKHADLSLIIVALDRCCKLIQDICGGKISKLCCAGNNVFEKKVISVEKKKISSYLGCKVSDEFIVKTLKCSGFKVDIDDEKLKVEINEGRNDLEKDVDIIEEIAKYYGYDRLPEEMPNASIASTPSSSEFILIDSLKDIITKIGFTEVINPGLMDENEMDFSFGLPIEIVNPLSKNYSFLRSSLVPGVLKNLRDNHNRKIECVSFFEIGNIYYRDGSRLIEEPAICLGSMNKETFYLFKGKVETILQEIGYFKSSQKVTRIKEGTSIEFLVEHDFVGRILLPSEDILKKYEIERQQIFLAEIMLKKFIDSGFPEVSYTPLSKFLPVTRDISLLIPDNVNWLDVENFIYSQIKQIEKIEIFDIYKGSKIASEYTSVSIRLIFSNVDGNLSREGVEDIIKDLLNSLEKNFSVQLRK